MQADFDVRWCRGPVAERFFEPLVLHLQSLGGKVLSQRRVQGVQIASQAQKST